MRHAALRTFETNYRPADPAEHGVKTGNLETLNRALAQALRRMGDLSQSIVHRTGRWRGCKRKTDAEKRERKRRNHINRVRNMTPEQRAAWLKMRREAAQRYRDRKRK